MIMLELPTYIDERAKKFFRRAHLHNGKEARWEFQFDTGHEDLMPTQIIVMHSVKRCVYCGNKAYPIQGDLRRGHGPLQEWNCRETGLTCICKDAMNEVDVTLKLKKFDEETQKNRRAISSEMPKPNIDALIIKQKEYWENRITDHRFISMRDLSDRDGDAVRGQPPNADIDDLDF